MGLLFYFCVHICSMNLLTRIEQFEKQAPECVFTWHDRETEARGWLVINSLRGGAAGGGTRMRKGLTYAEMCSLAKIMEVKFSVTGPTIGGAKSGIDFDPRDPRKAGVLARWFKAILPLLTAYYGTGGDLNVSESEEVRPYTVALGHPHPQAGIAVGHYGHAGLAARVDRLKRGVAMVLGGDYAQGVATTVSDMITGYGVAVAVRHFYTLWGSALALGELADKRAIIQGWGNVSAAAALYLARWGVRIVAITDKDGGIINEQGFTLSEIETLFATKQNNLLVHPQKMESGALRSSFYQVPADIFVPGAASRLLTQAHVEALIGAGVELISCGANLPFVEDQIFYGTTTRYVDNHVALLPDFIANCGMARVFAFLMEQQDSLDEDRIFEDVSTTIYDRLKQVQLCVPAGRKITYQAFEQVFDRLLA